MTRHRVEVIGAFLCGIILALAFVRPVSSRPADFCERKPDHPRCPTTTLGPTPVVTVSATSAPVSLQPPSPTATTVVPATATPTATVTPDAGVYGTAIAADGKDNRWIGGTTPGREVAHRWRSAGGQMIEYRFNQRFGPDGSGYSMGTGGLIELSLYRCDPVPTGSPISTTTFQPSNPKTTAEHRDAIPWSATVPAGIVCITHRNIHSSPTTNWMSANELWVPGGQVDSPRQPAFPDDSLAVLWRNENGASAWSLKANNTPVFDVTFSDGRHEGQAYYERFAGSNELVTGAGDKVRERFTPHSTTNVTAVWLRVNRRSGSTLTVSLGGTTGTASIASVPLEQFIADVWTGGKWVRVPLTTTLPANVEQSAMFSTDGSIRVAPIREPLGWGSRRFTDGVAEKSVGGGSWQPMYFDGVADLQFYVETVQ